MPLARSLWQPRQVVLPPNVRSRQVLQNFSILTWRGFRADCFAWLQRSFSMLGVGCSAVFLPVGANALREEATRPEDREQPSYGRLPFCHHLHVRHCRHMGCTSLGPMGGGK